MMQHLVESTTVCYSLNVTASYRISHCATHLIVQHPVESPTVFYWLNAATLCRIYHCVLLTECYSIL